MYVPKHFSVDDLAAIKQVMSENEFAVVISSDQGIPIASHLLVEMQEDASGNILLNAHMARNNLQWSTFDSRTEILAVFQGPHTYISPTWYHVHSVPTWNYVAVHAYGHPRIIVDRSELYASLERLVDREEQSNGTGMRYRLKDSPPDFVDRMLEGVVGFQIAVNRIEATFKLSQNRSDDDRRRIMVELRKRADENSLGVAEAMESHPPQTRAEKP